MGAKKLSTKEKWFALLEEAIKEGAKIQVNHRFKYKGKNLGTYLTDLRAHKKYDIIQEIYDMGFDFSMHSNEPKDLLKRFTKQLREDKDPVKPRYITRFNQTILPKKDLYIKKEMNELNAVWKLKFGDDRKWVKPTQLKERVKLWKRFRYSKSKNPQGKWFAPKSKMKDIYFWVYGQLRNPHRMEAVRHLFKDNEIKELKKEGFFKEFVPRPKKKIGNK